jgi:type I restriction enzyme, S subunit
MSQSNVIPKTRNRWPTVRFDGILQRINRKTFLDDSSSYNCVGVRWYGNGAFVRERLIGLEISRKQQWIIRSGDVVYNKLFAWKGAFAVADETVDGCIVSDKFPTYELNRSLVDPKYLQYYFRTPPLWRQAEATSKGAAAISKLTLNPPQFWDLTILLPPLDEQHRIVTWLEALAAKVGEALEERRQTEEQVEALFGAALDRTVGQLRQKYENQILMHLVEQERGISYGVVLTGAPNDKGVPTLRAGDLQKFRVILSNVKRIDPDIEAKYRRTRLQGNELLLRIRGGLGELAVCPPEMVGGNVSREIAVIPFTDSVLAKFGMYVLAAPESQSRMRAQLRGTSYVGINLRDVRTLPIPLAPIADQQKIVAYLDDIRAKVDSLKKLESETAAELDALLPSVLSKAFSGDL